MLSDARGLKCAGVRSVARGPAAGVVRICERARQRGRDREMESKAQTTSLYVTELLSLPSCDQWH